MANTRRPRATPQPEDGADARARAHRPSARRRREHPRLAAIVTIAPQEGKSVRVAGDVPTWLLTQNPNLRIVTASYGQSLANRNGLAIRRRITGHPDLGLTVAPDNGAAADWSIDGHDGGVFSVGIGAGVTGRAADVLIIDDPIKSRTDADSAVYRDRAWDWWTDEASARLAPGAPVILILTQWHHDDLADRLQDRDKDAGWAVLNIPARCENPDTDPLGRSEGEYMTSARGHTRNQWLKRERTAGTRTWASLYQGRPTRTAGTCSLPMHGLATRLRCGSSGRMGHGSLRRRTVTRTSSSRGRGTSRSRTPSTPTTSSAKSGCAGA